MHDHRPTLTSDDCEAENQIRMQTFGDFLPHTFLTRKHWLHLQLHPRIGYKVIACRHYSVCLYLAINLYHAGLGRGIILPNTETIA